MVDLAPLIVTAQRLITENGRSVTFIQHDSTPAVSANPWDGPTDARAAPDSTAVMDAVFVNPGSAAQLGLATEQADLIMKSEQIMIVSPGAVDLDIFQEVLDAGTYWKIMNIQVLKPGSVIALAFIGVAR